MTQIKAGTQVRHPNLNQPLTVEKLGAFVAHVRWMQGGLVQKNVLPLRELSVVEVDPAPLSLALALRRL